MFWIAMMGARARWDCFFVNSEHSDARFVHILVLLRIIFWPIQTFDPMMEVDIGYMPKIVVVPSFFNFSNFCVKRRHQRDLWKRIGALCTYSNSIQSYVLEVVDAVKAESKTLNRHISAENNKKKFNDWNVSYLFGSWKLCQSTVRCLRLSL